LPLLWLVVPSRARNAAFSALKTAFPPSTAATRAATVSTCAVNSLISATTNSTTASEPC